MEFTSLNDDILNIIFADVYGHTYLVLKNKPDVKYIKASPMSINNKPTEFNLELTKWYWIHCEAFRGPCLYYISTVFRTEELFLYEDVFRWLIDDVLVDNTRIKSDNHILNHYTKIRHDTLKQILGALIVSRQDDDLVKIYCDKHPENISCIIHFMIRIEDTRMLGRIHDAYNRPFSCGDMEYALLKAKYNVFEYMLVDCYINPTTCAMIHNINTSVESSDNKYSK